MKVFWIPPIQSGENLPRIFDVEDTLFEILNFWYKEYKENKTKFLIFKLCSDGNYEIKKFEKVPNDIDNKILTNTIEEYLKK